MVLGSEKLRHLIIYSFLPKKKLQNEEKNKKAKGTKFV